jgi:RNA polymerase sigma-70 factor (ECF subfamily)
MNSLEPQTDEELMVLIQSHNHAAFSELVMRHSDRFYALSYRTLFHQSNAEDIVQESFLKLWNKPTLWQPKRGVQFTTWFYRIIINACYDCNKNKSAQEFSLFDHYFEEATDEGIVDQQFSDVEAALKNLPERQRTALNLCFYEGLSNKEAATIMGIRLKALQSLIMRAKASLKTHLNILEENDHEDR